MRFRLGSAETRKSSAITVRIVALAVLILAASATVLPQASTITTNDSVPISVVQFVPCAMEGVGEVVELSGELHVLFHVTLDAAGGAHIKIHFQPQGVSGVGLTTGDTYRGTGVTQNEESINGADEFTFVNNFRVIGQGSGNNLLVHQLVHVTINDNGTLTALVVNNNIDCK